MWQNKLETGNRFYDQQCWQEAHSCYLDAAELLDSLWQQEPENPQLMMGWITSMHSLAQLFEALEQPQRAIFFLMKPYQRMMEQVKSSNQTASFQFVLIRAVRSTLHPLLSFSQQHPMCDCCMEKLQAAKQWLDDAPGELAQTGVAKNEYEVREALH